MSHRYTVAARKLGIVSAIGAFLLIVIYMFTLAAGLLSLESPQQPIGDPYFSLLEILILLMMPFMVALMVAVHTWAPSETRVFSLTALAFMILVAGLTSSLHFVILTVSRQAAFAKLPWLSLVLSFKWPSVAYALDILAWDIFFALSVLFAAPVFSGCRLAMSIRVLLIVSGVLSAAGLSGIIVGNMQVRDVGIVGYTVVFSVAALLLAILFHRTKPRDPPYANRADIVNEDQF